MSCQYSITCYLYTVAISDNNINNLRSRSLERFMYVY